MKTIYLIRHGETDNNCNKILQGGNVDIGLNEKGRRQAEAFYQKYKSIPFKKIYTSSLIRSIESVEKLIARGIPHETIKELNEISFGIYDGKISSEGKESLYGQLMNAWNKGNLTAKMEGGESPLDVQERLEHVLEYILHQTEEDPILICMHGRAMRIFLATVLNYDLSYMHLFTHHNLGLYVLQYTGTMFFIEKFNDTTHLRNLDLQKAPL
jgi:broad specificity phosphatase PhoE